MADELDRLFELLVEALARDARLAIPFAASEVHERLVPYRSNRSRLNVATHQDYEMTVLRLLAGERDYLRLEPAEACEKLRAETAAVNPDTGFFRNFADAQVLVNRIAAERHLRGHEIVAPHADPDPEPSRGVAAAPDPPPDPVPVVVAAALPVAEPPSPPRGSREPVFELVEPSDLLESDHCVYCGGPLPTNRDVNFCPQCGQPASGEPKCPACGLPVDVGWSYCVGCGRATGFE